MLKRLIDTSIANRYNLYNIELYNIEVVDSNIIVVILIDLLLLDRLINLIVNLIVLWIDY